MKIRQLLTLTCLLASFGVMADSKKEVKVETTDDLRMVAKLSSSSDLPVLVFFSTSTCSYCQILESQYLKPMIISGDYRDKIIIRKISLDEVGAVRDFQGNLVSSSDLVSRYNVSTIPTMLFLDAKGKELAKRVVGVSTVDYFWVDLDTAIQSARDSMRDNAKRVSVR